MTSDPLDANENVVDVNPAAQTMIGLEPSRAIGQPASAVLERWPGLYERVRQVEFGRDEISVSGTEGERAYQVTVSPIGANAREPLGRVIVLHDITDVRNARDAAEAATRAKSAFTATLSHEIRTPMNVILGFARLLSQDSSLTPSQRERVGLIRESGEHMLSLLNEALDLAKVEAGRMSVQPVSVDLRRFVAGLDSLFRPGAIEKALSLQIELDGEFPRCVRVDERKLRQILINLLSNALKYTPTGSITLTAGTLPSGRKGSWRTVRFAVEDTGVGIRPEDLVRLFEPFSQAARGKAGDEGTGLGLALSREFARLMGGELRVRSQLGIGSTFELDVPVALIPDDALDAPPALPERRVLGLAPGQERRRILVVDDHAPNRALLTSVLEALNETAPGLPTLEVRQAATGPEAIALWESLQPHLLFMDMRLPGLSGIEVTREIRSRAAGQAPVAIVGLSASVFEEDKKAFLAAGGDEFVPKPFPEQAISDALSRHLGLRFLYGEGGAAAER